LIFSFMRRYWSAWRLTARSPRDVAWFARAILWSSVSPAGAFRPWKFFLKRDCRRGGFPIFDGSRARPLSRAALPSLSSTRADGVSPPTSWIVLEFLELGLESDSRLLRGRMRCISESALAQRLGIFDARGSRQIGRTDVIWLSRWRMWCVCCGPSRKFGCFGTGFDGFPLPRRFVSLRL